MSFESLPNKGVIAPPITLQNTKGVFAALEILELGVARQAMVRWNQYHCGFEGNI